MATSNTTTKGKGSTAQLQRMDLSPEDMSALVALIPEMQIDEEFEAVFDSTSYDTTETTKTKKRVTKTSRDKTDKNADLVPLKIEDAMEVDQDTHNIEEEDDHAPTLKKLNVEIEDITEELGEITDDEEITDEEKLQKLNSRIDEFTEYLTKLEESPEDEIDDTDDNTINLMSLNTFEMNEYRNTLGTITFENMPTRVQEDTVNCVFTGVMSVYGGNDDVDEDNTAIMVLFDNNGVWENHAIKMSIINSLTVYPDDGAPVVDVSW